MKVRLVMYDWRQKGVVGSIYGTELGIELSLGDLHNGTTFPAKIDMEPDIIAEIRAAWRDHLAYPIMAIIPTAQDMKEEGKE